MYRLETDPVGHSIAKQLREVPEPTRRIFCAEVCNAALSRADVTHPALREAVDEIRSGHVAKFRRDAVGAIVHELDVVAWDLADEGGEAYLTAFRHARAAAAVEQGIGEPSVAAWETAYEAHHAGLALAEVKQLLADCL
ncbi:hypothetical protein [Micromonospora sp. C95]|uniref:hypothetical protein n=1 Tax=Micromonospora sp. C95 TaxID=2824882 RepID=UPI001B36399E|nr:hypothetical protein [Micromonospora sp. C95]MBQ1027939.1 hypothetical protein [Micromonospora sp. C95]